MACRPLGMLGVWASVFISLCACRAHSRSAGEPAPSLRYTVTYQREPEPALDVELRLSDPEAPREFLFTQQGRVDTVRLLDARGAETGTLDVGDDGAVVLPASARGLRYHYPLGSHSHRSHADFFAGMGQEDAWHVGGRAWLLRPRVAEMSLHAELVFQGTDALPPWTPDARGVYELTGDDLVNSGFLGVGGRRCTVHPAGGEVEVAILGRTTHVDDATLCAWVLQAANEVLTVRHTFPFPRITVRLAVVPHRDDPGLFGMLLWSSPPSISVLVGQESSPAEFAHDWVLVHEMLHMTHPTFMPHVAWLTEGIATYYTELARARSGRQTAEHAWNELLKGFNRGHAEVGSHTLQEVVTDDDTYQGLYWSGALFALDLDVRLRRVTHNARGLDAVLDLLATTHPVATLEDFGAAVDQVAGQPLFQALLDQHWTRPAFAEQAGLLQALGVKVVTGGVKLEAAPDSALRERLEAPRPGLVRATPPAEGKSL